MQKPAADSSSDFRIFETDEFIGGLSAMSPQAAQFLRRKLAAHVYPQLRREPYFGLNIKKLRGYTPNTWRYRIGKYRVFFIIDPGKKIVFIVSVDFRRDAYR
jgi:mRNA interferase RelE/StbE